MELLVNSSQSNQPEIIGTCRGLATEEDTQQGTFDLLSVAPRRCPSAGEKDSLRQSWTPMDGDAVVVPFSVESTWTVLKGSLESCVSVVFLDSETHEPIITSSPEPSTKTFLIPPVEPIPCEITVKFEGRPCHVQSFYASSAARIYEIYSQLNHETDAEYVCTIKGWIPFKDDCLGDICTEENSEEATVKKGDESLVTGSDGSYDSAQNSSKSSIASSIPVSHHSVDDECQNSVYSSGEDSWVNVKPNGSLFAEDTCANLMVPDLNSRHMPLNIEGSVHLDGQLCVANLMPESKKKLESDITPHERSFDEKVSIEQGERGSSGLEIFEAEVELVDQKPWAAVTIRLLSLQDKSVVEVDQMVFLAIPGTVLEPTTTTGSFNGSDSVSSLFAMFLPNMLQMAREVSLNSKVLFETRETSQPDKQKLKSGVPHAEVEFETSQKGAMLQELPLLEASKPSSILHKAMDSASSKFDHQVQLECDRSGSQEPDEAENIPQISIDPCNQALKTCICSCHLDEVIRKELALTFDAFSDRFDRLELLCTKLESFLHRTFECLEQRITNLEVEHAKVSPRQNSTNNQMGTPLDFPNMHSDGNVHPGVMKSMELELESAKAGEPCHSMEHHNKAKCFNAASLLNTTESEGEVSAKLLDCDHLEMHHAIKEASPVPDINANLTDIKNVVEENFSEICNISLEPEVTELTASMDKLPHFSLDDAWSSALSAFASSFPSKDPDMVCNASSISERESIGSAGNDEFVSSVHFFKELEKDRNSSSISAVTNNVSAEAINTALWLSDGFCEEVNCDDWKLIAQGALGTDTLPFTSTVMLRPPLISNFLAFEELGNRQIQKPVECIRIIDKIEEQHVMQTLLPINVAAPKPVHALDLKVESIPDSLDATSHPVIFQQEAPPAFSLYDMVSSADLECMRAAESSDWGSIGGLRTGFSPVFQLSSGENGDAASHVGNTRAEIKEMAAFDLFGGNTDYIFLQDKAPQDVHSASLASLYAKSSNSRFVNNKENNMCMEPFELDLLNGHELFGQVECSNAAGPQDPEFSRSFMYFMTEEVSSIPDLLDHSLNYQDGRACSPESLCFSQDFDSCLNELHEMRWKCAPKVLYTHNPKLTEDEDDAIEFTLDASTETSDASVQDDLSDTLSTQNMPVWPVALDAKQGLQTALTVFPGFENL